ncbi:hypothetical protein CTA1_1075 [Colletotrichum tanaceti]|uniref:Uncharacterized protein n=1 Tax=Colletotrichum tanaceti TaxID=1306861 RepID=A0A4U6X8P5_9PEZI|nr:hypothetical protein CTA1_1075 [Colletotrichum tanaceti]
MKPMRERAGALFLLSLYTAAKFNATSEALCKATETFQANLDSRQPAPPPAQALALISCGRGGDYQRLYGPLRHPQRRSPSPRRYPPSPSSYTYGPSNHTYRPPSDLYSLPAEPPEECIGFIQEEPEEVGPLIWPQDWQSEASEEAGPSDYAYGLQRYLPSEASEGSDKDSPPDQRYSPPDDAYGPPSPGPYPSGLSDYAYGPPDNTYSLSDYTYSPPDDYGLPDHGYRDYSDYDDDYDEYSDDYSE